MQTERTGRCAARGPTYFSCVEKSSLVSSSSHDSSHRCVVVSPPAPPVAASVSSAVQSVSPPLISYLNIREGERGKGRREGNRDGGNGGECTVYREVLKLVVLFQRGAGLLLRGCLLGGLLVRGDLVVFLGCLGS